MKTTLNSLLITAAGVALSAAAAYGQAQVAANIPFDFSASNQGYAAGEYLVAHLSHDGLWTRHVESQYPVRVPRRRWRAARGHVQSLSRIAGRLRP